MLGVSLSLTRAGRMARSGVTPPPPPPEAGETDPNVTAVQADGWRVTYQDPPASFDPVSDPKPVAVVRQGFDASGQAVAVPEVLTVMARTRAPYPNQAMPAPNDAALSDFVYQGDTLEVAANGSTRAYPRPFALWLDHDLRRVEGTAYTARLAVAHAYARAGRPVAAVRFSVTDGTNTVEATVSAMATLTWPASGFSVPHFAADLDLSALAADVLLTVDATIYPWVGEAFTISADAGAYPSATLTVLKIMRAVNYGRAVAHVDAVSGDNATGAVSADPATAAAQPFATVAAAATAIRSYNNAAFGRNDTGGGVIRLAEGAHVHGGLAPSGLMPLEVEAAGDRAATFYRDAGGHTIASLPEKCVFRGVTLQRTTGSNIIFLDGNAGSDPAHMAVFEDCAFDLNGFAASGAYTQRLGRVWMIGCTGDDFALASSYSTTFKAVTALGCDGAGALGSACFSAAGCRDLGAAVRIDGASGSRPARRMALFGWNHMGNGAGVPAVGLGAGLAGAAFAGNVIEAWGSDLGPVVEATLPGGAVDDWLWTMNTVAGARTNWLYLDAASGDNAKIGRDRFSIHRSFNMKGDVFEADGTLTGNWSNLWKAGYRASAYVEGSQGSDDPGPGSWMGEIRALGEAGGTDAAPLATDWADDRSVTGSGPGTGGGGDYTPGPGHALPAVPAGLAPWPHDLTGRLIKDDGTAIIGAIQPL